MKSSDLIITVLEEEIVRACVTEGLLCILQTLKGSQSLCLKASEKWEEVRRWGLVGGSECA